MDQATLQKIARLRRLAGQQGKPFDVMRFASEPDYARATLSTLLDTEDEETLVVGMALMNTLCPAAPPVAVPIPAPPPVVQPTPNAPPTADSNQRYVGRLR